MNTIEHLSTVCVCFAVDNNYAPYLSVTIRSLLHNRRRSLGYDILILCSALSGESKEAILSTVEGESGVSIRFIDVTQEEEALQYDVGSYLTVATNYRLLLFSELFSEYDRMIYLDSDTIVEGDISELFFTDMCGKSIAAVPDTGFRLLSLSKKAVFIDGKYPYNIDNYRTDALHMTHPEDYFNAGVILVDLQKCRKSFSYKDVTDILHSKKFNFNDQDVLNILFDGQVHILDYEWNYHNNVEAFCKMRPDVYEDLYRDVRRREPKIIHFVSSGKPWNRDVALSDYYYKYINQEK